MSVKLTGQLTAPFSTELVHESGARLQTTAPKDNGGDGNLFSPTDLFAASLGACGLTIMSLYADRHQIPLDGASFVLEKEMQTTGPRRVRKINITYRIHTTADDALYQRLVAAVRACPVRLSLHPDIELIEHFERI